MGDILAAAIQMQSTDAVDKNLEASLRLVHAAIKSGATLISLPENYAFLGSETDKDSLMVSKGQSPQADLLQSLISGKTHVKHRDCRKSLPRRATKDPRMLQELQRPPQAAPCRSPLERHAVY